MWNQKHRNVIVFASVFSNIVGRKIQQQKNWYILKCKTINLKPASNKMCCVRHLHRRAWEWEIELFNHADLSRQPKSAARHQKSDVISNSISIICIWSLRNFTFHSQFFRSNSVTKNVWDFYFWPWFDAGCSFHLISFCFVLSLVFFLVVVSFYGCCFGFFVSIWLSHFQIHPSSVS